jgi:hypothetical protein
MPLRAIQDGEFAAVHVEYDLWGPKAGFDIHRFEHGLIVEQGQFARPSRTTKSKRAYNVGR